MTDILLIDDSASDRMLIEQAFARTAAPIEVIDLPTRESDTAGSSSIPSSTEHTLVSGE